MAAPKRSTYTVTYESENHWSVLTQMWGSAWPNVLPYCLFNVLVMIVLIYLDRHFNQTLSIEVSTQGHSFLTLVVAFLLVSRVNMAMGRYSAARAHLGTMYRETREMTQNLCVFSGHDKSPKAVAWRGEVTYRLLILLRTAMAVLDYPTLKQPAWAVPELEGEVLEDVKKSVFLGNETLRWAHAPRSEWEETMRVPIRIAYLLRKTIHDQANNVSPAIQLAHENKLLGSVDSFMGGYYGMRAFMTTPVPFPLIQMARTFLFLYVFTVPFVLLKDESSDFAHCFTVFLMTYGFMGLEVVAIELDNPFGDDPNDFDNYAMALTAFEDTYLTVLDVDGMEATDKLRLRMHDKTTDELPSEQSWLLSKMV